MYATATNTKNKGSSLSMALRAVATERAVSFTNTALRRGETGSCGGSVVEIPKSEFLSKCGARYIESFDAENRSSDPKVGQIQNRERHHSGANVLASLCNLWCRLKALKPRWRPLTRANYLSVLLTNRSTGPIAACRHLGYKSLAQMPSRHNGPVSSNVRPRCAR